MSKSHEGDNSPATRCLPPLYALCAFETTARYASFIRAGEELAITQSVVSRHIRILEEYSDRRPFGRYGHQLQLTEPVRLSLPGLRGSFDALRRACTILCVDDATLCLKAPSTLTLRWLLLRPNRFRHLNPGIEVQLASTWMDVDSVDFQRESFNCAVLLGSGQFSSEWETAALLAEWLVPVCDPDEVVESWTFQRLRDNELLYPTPGRRDWRRWLQRTGLGDEVSLKGGQVLDTLELGIVVAARGYGVSIGDLVMVVEDITQGRIGLPWPVAVVSGESYHLVWPRARRGWKRFQRLRDFPLAEVAVMRLLVVERLT